MDGLNPVAATHRRIAMLVVDGVSLIDVATVSELLADACRHGGVYDLVVCSPDGKDIATRSGLPLTVAADAHDIGPVDTAVLLAGDDLIHHLPTREHISAARHLAGQACRLATTGSGPFVLGAAGLLHGRRVTTDRRYAHLLQELHPSAQIVSQTPLATDGGLLTSAGEGAARALALALVDRDRDDVTRHSAGPGCDLTPDQRAGYGTGASETASVPVNPLVRELTSQIVADPCAQSSLSDLAAKVAVSPRHLARLFQEELHTTPAKFVEQVRFDTARRLLDRGLSVTDSAFRSGFGSLEAQRRAFTNRLGVSPRAYQKRLKSGPPAALSPVPPLLPAASAEPQGTRRAMRRPPSDPHRLRAYRGGRLTASG
ncbi:GlxA family transcriptional regulator [Streptomyces sp. NPDC057694]|uniref:GlxA family transcriptional regulator n=1 Tax=Streptomyces sp. NPDC057694 TaxID=3346216 RepID=UPI00368758FA